MQRFRSVIAFAAAATLTAAHAAPDEIQVYTDDLNKPGEFGLEMHMNYVTRGDKQAAWDGQSPVHHMFRFTPEFSYGVSEHFDVGLYLPMLRTNQDEYHLEGAKLRAKYLVAGDGNPFYWGLNMELGKVSLRAEEHHWNVEFRPILGYKLTNWEFTLNPILGWSISDRRGGAPAFEPAGKVAYRLTDALSVGVEHYAALGPVNNLLPRGQQEHATFVVMDAKVGGTDVNFGIGHGNSNSQDTWVVKGIVGFGF